MQPRTGRDSIAQGEQSEALGYSANTEQSPTGARFLNPRQIAHQIRFHDALGAAGIRPERDHAVVLLLVGDVGFDPWGVGSAHRERSIARLPLKTSQGWSLLF